MKSISSFDWQAATETLHGQGFALLPGVLNPGQCHSLTGLYEQETLFRKTISMERYRFGRGEYKYFRYPLPELVQCLRQDLYAHLAPVANAWMQALRIDLTYPGHLDGLQTLCIGQGQTKPTPLLLRYAKGGYNTLHQDLYGQVYFPFQAVAFLSQPGEDFTGGEFVLVEGRPRAQSQARVLTPDRGDVLLFTTHFRPVKSTRGYYRAGIKHGVSQVLSGNRHTLGIIFHDAA